MNQATPWPLRQVQLRLVLGSMLLIPVALVWGEALVGASLPAYRVVISQLLSDFEVQSIVLDRERSDRVVRVHVRPRTMMWVGGKPFVPDARSTANASTLMAHALLGPLLACLVVLAWHAASWRNYGMRLLLLVPAVALPLVVDVPSVLAAELWAIVIDMMAPDSFSPQIAWKDFLQGGGRFALGLVAGGLCVGLANRMNTYRRAEAPQGTS